jgi:ubiquinone/menaquinone biosynthesis C-methylase UbiE
MVESYIMKREAHRLCPLEKAKKLDSGLRRWLHNPRKILGRYVRPGMTILDFGCGPGLFSIELARMTGEKGKVIAADLQEGMLEILKNKLTESNKGIIKLHKCEENRIGVTERVDFVLAFYVVHEVPSQREFFKEIMTILRPGGAVLVIEPKSRVTKSEFEEFRQAAISTGFECEKGPRVFMSRSMVLRRETT